VTYKEYIVEGDSNICLWYIKIRIELFSGIHSYKANRMSFIIAELLAKIAGIRADVPF